MLLNTILPDFPASTVPNFLPPWCSSIRHSRSELHRPNAARGKYYALDLFSVNLNSTLPEAATVQINPSTCLECFDDQVCGLHWRIGYRAYE